MSIKRGDTTVLQNFVNVPITSTINENSTNEECSGAKAVYDIVKDQLTNNVMQDGDDMNLIPTRYHNCYHHISNAVMPNILNSPYTQGLTTSSTGGFIFTFALGIVRQIFINNAGEIFFRCGYYENSDSTSVIWNDVWKKTSETKVGDIPKTNLTFTDETNYTKNSEVDNFYYVRNGICYVRIYIKCVTPNQSTSNVLSGLPIPKYTEFRTIGGWSGTTDCIKCIISTSGELGFRYGTTNGLYIETISYPVSES